MVSYLDLGFNDLMQTQTFQAPLSAEQSDSQFEGVGAGQILKSGRIESADGNWFIDMDRGVVKLPSTSIQTSNIAYATRFFKATVAVDGSGDFTDIQDAIDYVNQEGGGSIYISAGTYTINKNINIYSNISLFGTGKGKTILDFHGTGYQIRLVGTTDDFSTLMAYDDAALGNITIEGISFINGGVNNDLNHVLYFKYVRNLIIRGCLFTNNRRDIHVINSLNVLIELNDFITSNGYSVISNGNTIDITNNHFNLTGNAITVRGLGSGVLTVIENNRIGGANTAIDGYQTQNLIVKNNVIDDSIDNGINISGSIYSSIIDNKISDGDYGISINKNYASNDSAYNEVSGNTLVGIATDAINVMTSNWTNVSRNNCYSCDRAIYINNNSDRTIVSNNQTSECTTKITNNGTNTVLDNNIIS